MLHENISMNCLKELIDCCLVLKRYYPQKCLQIIKVCEYIDSSNNLSFDNLNKLYFLYNEYLNAVPSEQYESHIVLSKKFIAIMQFWMQVKCNSENRYQYCSVFLNIAESYSNLDRLLSTMGMPGIAWNYCMLSLTFNPNENEKLQDLDRALALWSECINIRIDGSRETLIFIMTNYFYLSRIFGHNREDCYKLFKITSKWLKTSVEATEYDIKYLAYFACFLLTTYAEDFNVELAKMVFGKLKTQYEVEKDRKIQDALLICQTLSVVSSLIGENNVEWAVKGLNIIKNNKGVGDAFSNADISLTVLLREEGFSKSNVREVLMEFLKSLDKFNNKIINWLQRARLSQLVNRCIAYAVNHGEYKFAIECAYLWRGYDCDDDLKLPQDEIIILVIHNLWIDEIAYLIWNGENSELIKIHRNVTLEEVIEAKNSFEGSWTTIIGKQYFGGDLYSRPDPSKSFEYFSKLEGYYVPKGIANIINSLNSTKIARIIEAAWLNSPLAALVSSYTDKEISNFVNIKLQEQAHIRKVLIWSNPDSSLFTANMEKEAIIKVLTMNKDVSIEIYSGEECTYEIFINKYKNSEFDLIWIMCHGDFDYDNPANSQLHISVTTSVNLLDLNNATPERQKRRLLVLNACQSGCSSVRYLAMNFIGFGSVLTNMFQSVVGHLWSVDSLAAAAFGVIFCHNLLKDIPWGIAANISRKSLAKDNYEIYTLLKEEIKLDGETSIMNAVKNRSEGLNKLYYWGSPVLFE